MQDAFPSKETQPEVVHHVVRIEGAGAAAPSKEFGAGVAIAYVDTGRYKATWSENPGRFIGMTPGLEAATPGDLAGYTVVADTYDSSTYSIEFYVHDDTDAAADLGADEYLVLDFRFTRTSV